MIDFTGRVVVITGAAGSLGSEYARAFARRGAHLVINDAGTRMDGTDSTGGAAELLAEELRGLGAAAIVNSDSVSDRAGARRLIAQTLDEFGRIDVLVNNAGIMRDKVFKKMDLDDFDEVVRVHLMGSTYVTREAFPLMVGQN